jgi:exonuclease III
MQLLLSNDVEKNPGPDQIKCLNKENFTICSYNVNGLKNFNKLKRVSSFLNSLPFKNNCVINLQETHLNINEVNRLNYQWRSGAIHSPSTQASAGVSILYNKSFFDKIISSYHDDNGRICMLTASKDAQIMCFINIYSPNNHNAAIGFYNSIENLIQNEIEKDQSVKFYISGDFNLVLNPHVDSIGRRQTSQEKAAVDKVKLLMTKFKLIDSYRLLNTWGGFTWGRDTPHCLRSRLDMILISKTYDTNIQESASCKYPNESDHYFLYTALSFESIKYGRGIIRCNASLLEDDAIKNVVETRLTEECNSMSADWNPHLQLDYIKMKTRQLLLEEGKKAAIAAKSAFNHTNEEINKLETKRDKILSQIPRMSNEAAINAAVTVDRITEAINMIKPQLEISKDEEAKRLIFRSRAKWAEQGERSTKYFLNLIKERQAKMIIRKIICNGQTHLLQDEITKAIVNFYKDLYKKQPNLKPAEESDFLNDLPKLSDEQSQEMQKELTQWFSN